MARKNKGRADNSAPSGQISGGFVPASPQHGTRRGPNSLEFGAANAGASDSAAQYARTDAHYSHRKSGRARVKIVALAVVIIALVGTGAAFGFTIFKDSQKNAINTDLHDNFSEEEMQAVDNELTGMMSFDQPFTMLLLGSDERTGDPDMGARTDTIVLVRIDPIQNKVAMVSIPRDTMTTIEGVGTAKFNAAYAYGGPSGTIAAVKELCGVDIDHFAEINFEGLVGLIDAIGGIDVMVDEIIDDPAAGDVVIPEGQQHLDGEAALVFSRTRAYANGDFTRVSNQRRVIEAIAHKGLEAPASDLYGIVRASTGFLTTDSGMDVDFIYSLADQMRHNEATLQIYSGTIPATTGMVDGVSYVIADKAGVAELMQVFLACGDVSAGVAASSIDEDVNAAGGRTSSSNASAAEAAGYYEEPTYYYEEPQATGDTGGGEAAPAADGAGAADAAAATADPAAAPAA